MRTIVTRPTARRSGLRTLIVAIAAGVLGCDSADVHGVLAPDPFLLVAATSASAGDQATGTGIRTAFGETFTVEVNAESGPAGEDARGHFYINSPPGQEPQFTATIAGSVICLTVAGHRAMAGGVVEKSEGGLLAQAFPVGSGILIEVVDNDQTGGEDGSDIESTVAPPAACPLPVIPENELERGNYVVHDAP